MRMRVISLKSQSCDTESWKLLFWHTSSLSRDNISTPSSMCRQSCFVGAAFLTHHYPPLSSVSGVWKEDLSEFGGKSLNSLSPSDLGWSFDHSWHRSASLLLDLRYFLQLYFWTRGKKVMSKIELGNDCSSPLQKGDVSSDILTVTVSLSSQEWWSGKSWLTSEQWKPIQYSCRAAAMRRVSQVEDSAIRNVLICVPILTPMTL